MELVDPQSHAAKPTRAAWPKRSK